MDNHYSNEKNDEKRLNGACSGHADQSCIFRYGNQKYFNDEVKMRKFVLNRFPVCDMHKIIVLNQLGRL